MRRMLPVFILLGLFIELAVMIAVGRRLGVLATLLLIMGSGLLGGAVIRSAGLGLMQALQRPGRVIRFTTLSAAAGFLYLLAGLLLMVPGFVSDIIGLLLLPLPVREWLAQKLLNKVIPWGWREPCGPGKVIEGEAIEIEGELVNRPDTP